ncbi:MAG TPA: hypothetical protein VFT31_10955 [Kribbella sp.]|nr:hypothetical protein [Kribbella sp.]
MTVPSPREPAAVYELTVVGALGPVLRMALEPCATASSQLQTILRTKLPADRDLVDLVALLESRGLQIETLAALT